MSNQTSENNKLGQRDRSIDSFRRLLGILIFLLIAGHLWKLLFTPNSPLEDTQYIFKTYFYGNNKNINPRRAHH